MKENWPSDEDDQNDDALDQNWNAAPICATSNFLQYFQSAAQMFEMFGRQASNVLHSFVNIWQKSAPPSILPALFAISEKSSSIQNISQVKHLYFLAIDGLD